MAGLACARDLAGAGRRVVVLERARGVGGRCATRRIDGQPADTGPAFLHGHHPAFLAALDEVGAERVDWPRAVEGQRSPCHPGSLEPGERRVAFAEGVTALPKHLARGLDVRLGSNVDALEEAPGAVVARVGAEAYGAPAIVLTPPVPRTVALLANLAAGSPGLRGLSRLLGAVRCEATLALVARYPDGTDLPAWDLCHPDGDVLQVVAVDSRKRPGGLPTVVAQARPRWSAARVDGPPEAWGAEILDALAALMGPWAARPDATYAHRWRHARVDRSAFWPSPVVATLPGGARVALAGELFAPGGGVQGAYLSGRATAARLLETQ